MKHGTKFCVIYLLIHLNITRVVDATTNNQPQDAKSHILSQSTGNFESKGELETQIAALKQELSTIKSDHKTALDKLEKKFDMKLKAHNVDWSSGKEYRLEETEDNLLELEDVLSGLKSDFLANKKIVNTEIKKITENIKTTEHSKTSTSWKEEKLFSYINDLQDESLRTSLKIASHKKSLDNLSDSHNKLTKNVEKIHADYLSLILKILAIQGTANQQTSTNRSQTHHGFIVTHTESRVLSKGIVSFDKIFYNSGYFDTSSFKFTCPMDGMYQVSLSTCISEDYDDMKANADLGVVMDAFDKDHLLEVLTPSGAYINYRSSATKTVYCYTGETIWLAITKAGTLWADNKYQCPTYSVMFLEDII